MRRLDGCISMLLGILLGAIFVGIFIFVYENSGPEVQSAFQFFPLAK